MSQANILLLLKIPFLSFVCYDSLFQLQLAGGVQTKVVVIRVMVEAGATSEVEVVVAVDVDIITQMDIEEVMIIQETFQMHQEELPQIE